MSDRLRMGLGIALVAAAVAGSQLVPFTVRQDDEPPPAAGVGDCDGADSKPADGELREATAATLCLLNAERGRHGLRPLRRDRRLDRAARRHARDLVRRRYFAHESPEAVDAHERIAAAGYRPPPGGATGENLAWGQDGQARPAEIVAGWMDSPGHRANILGRRFVRVGVAIVRGAPARTLPEDPPAATYVTTFG